MTKVVSTQGLVRRPTFEEVLNAAIKDEHSKDGLLSVPMQRFATKMINSPLFQRVQSTVETELEKQEQNKMEHDDLQNDLHRFSVATGIPQDTIQYVVQNLQQPTPAPPMQVGITSDARADFARMQAEMDLRMQQMAVQQSHQNIAAGVSRQMAAQTTMTPLQQLIHQVQPPAPMVPPHDPTLSGIMRRTGLSAHEVADRMLRGMDVDSGPAPPLPPPSAPAPSQALALPPPPVGLASTPSFAPAAVMDVSSSTRRPASAAAPAQPPASKARTAPKAPPFKAPPFKKAPPTKPPAPAPQGIQPVAYTPNFVYSKPGAPPPKATIAPAPKASATQVTGLTGPMPVATTPRGNLLAASSSSSASVPSFADVYGIRAAARSRRAANPNVITPAIQRMQELYQRQTGVARTGNSVKRKKPEPDEVTGLRAPRGRKRQDTRQVASASTQYFDLGRP